MAEKREYAGDKPSSRNLLWEDPEGKAWLQQINKVKGLREYKQDDQGKSHIEDFPEAKILMVVQSIQEKARAPVAQAVFVSFLTLLSMCRDVIKRVTPDVSTAESCLKAQYMLAAVVRDQLRDYAANSLGSMLFHVLAEFAPIECYWAFKQSAMLCLDVSTFAGIEIKKNLMGEHKSVLEYYESQQFKDTRAPVVQVSTSQFNSASVGCSSGNATSKTPMKMLYDKGFPGYLNDDCEEARSDFMKTTWAADSVAPAIVITGAIVLPYEENKALFDETEKRSGIQFSAGPCNTTLLQVCDFVLAYHLFEAFLSSCGASKVPAKEAFSEDSMQTAEATTAV